MRCRESPLLLSQVDAAVSGETSLDHESAARVSSDRPHDGQSKETYPRADHALLMNWNPAVKKERRWENGPDIQ